MSFPGMNNLAKRIAAEFPQIAGEIRVAWQRGEPYGWFEPLYQRAEREGFSIPWKSEGGHPSLREWLESAMPTAGQNAFVVGCGFGDDAELLSQFRYAVSAFDIAQTAIASCRKRFPETTVAYRVANLFALPDEWRLAFDLVLESRTIQSLPREMARSAAEAIADCVAPGGRLLVLTHGREEDEPFQGVPWPLARSDLAAFLAAGLQEEKFEIIPREEKPRLFRVTYRKESSQ